MGDWVAEASSSSYTDNTKRHHHHSKPNNAAEEERVPFEAHSISRKMLRSPNKKIVEEMAFADRVDLGKFSALEKHELKSLMDELQELYETM
jgi:hypothetical protein